MTQDNSNDIEKAANPGTALKSSQSLHHLEMLTPLAKKINCLDIKEIANVCIDDIPRLIKARFASLYILDETSDILHLEKNNHPFLINNIVSLNQNPPSPMVAAVRSKELMLVNDVESYKKPYINKTRTFSKNYNTNSCIIAPLICLGRVAGVLNLSDKIDATPFDTDDITVMELFRQLIGASIGNINLFEKTQHQAKTDGLTGMLNDKTFYETLETELRRSQRYGGQISIIMADIDNLKPINDKFGHHAGDYAIRQVSRKILSCIRHIDSAARYGGDEFSIILPNTSLADAVVVAQRMVRTVMETPVIWDNNEITISISVGVGQYDAANNCPEDVTKATDQALYAAKQAGKNTVKIFEQVSTS